MNSKKKYTEEQMIEFANFAKNYQSSPKVACAFEAYKNGVRLKKPNIEKKPPSPPKRPEPRIIKEPGFSIGLGCKKKQTKQICLVFSATNGESKLNYHNFTATSTIYSKAIDELINYLIDFFDGGFEFEIKNTIIKYGE